MAPNLKTKIIGIRDGEKLHEMMCPNESHYLTLEFKDHYVIFPSPNYFDSNISYKKNKSGELGKKVSKNFEYSSNNNINFLSVDKIKRLHKSLNDTI